MRRSSNAVHAILLFQVLRYSANALDNLKKQDWAYKARQLLAIGLPLSPLSQNNSAFVCKAAKMCEDFFSALICDRKDGSKCVGACLLASTRLSYCIPEVQARGWKYRLQTLLMEDALSVRFGGKPHPKESQPKCTHNFAVSFLKCSQAPRLEGHRAKGGQIHFQRTNCLTFALDRQHRWASSSCAQQHREIRSIRAKGARMSSLWRNDGPIHVLLIRNPFSATAEVD